MNAQSIVDDLQRSGINLFVVGDKLRLKADAEIPPKTIETVKQHKAKIIRFLQEEKKSSRARGYGCDNCGSQTYMAVRAWETYKLPTTSEWKHEHRAALHWQCEGCGAIFSIIGGSRGPIIIQ